jgi:hypothetical protein
MTQTELTLAELYTEDETAWLEAMAERIGAGAYADLDYANLREYLTDMANRERREVKSRLIVLLMHVLKWVHQPDRRSRSWKLSIVTQRQSLADATGRGVLRKHAAAILPEAYESAVELAATETGLFAPDFPPTCPYTLDELLAFDPSEPLAES